MRLQISDEFSEAYLFRMQLEFIFLSEYKKYCIHPDDTTKTKLIGFVGLLKQMPTRGAFTFAMLNTVDVQLGVMNDSAVAAEAPLCWENFFKVYMYQARALLTRVLRAIENVILTWGDPDNQLPPPLMITLLYLAWIFPLIRLASNLFSISRYVMGYEGTQEEKALPWMMRAADQAKRFWPELMTDVLWVGIRSTGCFVFSFPTPPPLPVSLFGSRVVLEAVTTAHYRRLYGALGEDELKNRIRKDHVTTTGIWFSYFVGALCGLINRNALVVGSLWITLTCVAQIAWELKIRKPPMVLTLVHANDKDAVGQELMAQRL